jgi:hypothetical protein
MGLFIYWLTVCYICTTGFLPGTCNDADGMSPPVRVEEFNPDSLWKCPTCDKADFQTYQDVSY